MSSSRYADPSFSLPDWCDPALYGPLLALDRAGWAWEWLRRNPAYEGARPSIVADMHRLGRAQVTVIRDQGDKEGTRWGLTFR